MKENKKILIAGGTIVIINILIVFLLILPTHKQIRADLEKFLEEKKALATITQELSDFKDFETKADLYLSDLGRMYGLITDQVFIDKELPINFITFLEEEAQKNGLSLKVTPILAPKEENALFNSINFQLNIEGQFPALLEFIKRTEHWQWLVETKLLSIAKNEKEGYIAANILIKAYVRE